MFAFEPFDFIGWDADKLDEPETGKLTLMEHLADFSELQPQRSAKDSGVNGREYNG